MAAMMCSGAALGMLYDAYRVVFREFRFPRWLVPPLDVMYWAVGTILVFRILYASNGGELRLFVFLALGIGVCFYFGVLSDAFVRAFRVALTALKRLVRFLVRLFVVLVVRPVVALYRAALVFFGFLAALSIFLGKLVLQLLYPLWKIAGWIARPIGRMLASAMRTERWLTPAVRRIARGWSRLTKRK